MMMRSTVVKKPGRKRSPVETWNGDSYSVALKKMVRLTRIIDRRRNLYYEKVQDPETREVLHEEEEHPLTEHRGHGDGRQ